MAKGRPRHDAAPPDEDDLFTRYTQVADRLADLLPQAHAAVKDLAAAVRDARQVIPAVRDEAAAMTKTAAAEELERFAAHVQREMDRAARDMNRALEAARLHVIRAITPRELSLDADTGQLRVWFEGERFDDGGYAERVATQHSGQIAGPAPPPPINEPFTADAVFRGVEMDDQTIGEFLDRLAVTMSPDPEDELAARLIAAEADAPAGAGTQEEIAAETARMIRQLRDEFGGPANARRARGLAAGFRRRGREDLAAATEYAASLPPPADRVNDRPEEETP
jgi:F0F1-type ATP synthase membrane subunit b/b'